MQTTTYTHLCPCGTNYTDTDPDIYLCDSCKEQRKAIAKSIDAKLVGKVAKNIKSDYQLYEEMRKNSAIQRGGIKFVDARNLM